MSRLPPELWLMIFELARGTGTEQYCNHLSFPYLNLHLWRPLEHPFTINQWPVNLRLVCRYFNSLLKPSPSFFMKDAEAVIPNATRALYILPQKQPQDCLERLLVDPSVCSRITLLNLTRFDSHITSPPTDFDFLCNNSHALPALRTLTARFRFPGVVSPAVPRFWYRLNKAFPLLTTFVLLGGLVTTYPDPEVVFENLEVVDWGYADYHQSLQFPAIRHASFSVVSHHELEYLIKWPHLQSLLIRGIDEGARFEWSSFPNLKLIGLPAQRVVTFPPPPPGHPLRHLYISIGTRPRDDHNQQLFAYERGLGWLKDVLERMPNITRLSLWFDKPGCNRVHWISAYFRTEDLEVLGWTQWYPACRSSGSGHHDIYERVKVEPRKEEQVAGEELVPKQSGFRVGWDKFVRSASRRLHL